MISKATFDKNLAVIVAISAFITGMLILIFLPPNIGADESVHFRRAYQISNGGILSTSQTVGDVVIYGGEISTTLDQYLLDTDAMVFRPRKYQLNETISAFTTPIPEGDEVIFREFNLASVYNPVNYLFTLPGLILSGNLAPTVGTVFYSARLSNLLVSSFLIYLIMKFVAHTKLKYLIAAILLTPINIIAISTITPDGITNIAAIGFIAIILTYFSDKSKLLGVKDNLLIYLTTFALVLAKQAYFPLVFLVLLLDKAKYRNGKAKFIIQSSQIALPLVLNFAWSLLVSGNYAPNSDISLTEAVTETVSSPLSVLLFMATELYKFDVVYFQQFFGNFRIINSFSFLPIYMLLIPLYLNLGINYINGLAKTAREKIIKASLLIFGLTTATMVGSLYLFWKVMLEQNSLGIQGRYFIPIAVLGIFVMSSVFREPLKLRLPTGKEDYYNMAIGIAIVGLNLINIVFGTIYTYYFVLS